MEFKDLFDQQTLDAILADAKEAGIDAADVEKVLNTIPNGGKTEPSRNADPESQLLDLMGEDKDALTDSVADATGVSRMNTSTILMLAAPFLLKYLLSNNNTGNSSASLLGSLLGMGQQQSSMGSMGSLLGALMGGGYQQPQTQNLTTSLLGSLLGGGVQQQPAYTTANTNSLLSSLLTSGAQQQVVQPIVQPVQTVQQPSSTGSLFNLFGGTQQQVQPIQQPQQNAGGSSRSDHNVQGA